MKIKKILNNNVVIATDFNQRETVIMGLGLGFNKSIGDLIEESKIEKTFVLKNDSTGIDWMNVLAEIPVEILELSITELAKAEKLLEKNFSDSVLIALADHLNTAILRTKEGVTVRNFLLWDIQSFFPTEFFLGKQILFDVEQKFNLILPEDEASFLAMHLINVECQQ